MRFSASQPIGIFDSGVGGLTVAHALTALLPREEIIYFGDVAHHPYGEKSPDALIQYALNICDFLIEQKVKLILIACHSAASAATEAIQAKYGARIKIIDVIDPAIDLIVSHPVLYKTLGIIGTRQTIYSGIYQKKIKRKRKDIDLKPLATPLLAPLIEEGCAHNHNPVFTQVLADYLSDGELCDIEALLLACTHYPLIKFPITAYYKRHHKTLPVLIDSAESTAYAVQQWLASSGLINLSEPKKSPGHAFYVSDYTPSFVASARFFFPDAVDQLHFRQYKL